MKNLILSATFVCLSYLSVGQGYGTMLFSVTGDTVLVRGSFGEMAKEDTITTVFLIQTRAPEGVGILAKIEIHEKRTAKHNVGFGCADISTIKKDTLNKYNLVNEGSFIGRHKAPFKSEAKVGHTEKRVIENKTLYCRNLEHRIWLDNRLVYEQQSLDIVEDVNQVTIPPRLHDVYYCEEIDKNFISFWIDFNRIDEKGKVISVHARKEAIS